MKQILLFFVFAATLFFFGCGTPNAQSNSAQYVTITAEQAKERMDTEENFVLLDVRTQEEYEQGYIPGAVLLPYDEISARAQELPLEKDTLILVYCRSGRRSKIAAQTLVDLGYTNVQEFGGILDWPYEITK